MEERDLHVDHLEIEMSSRMLDEGCPNCDAPIIGMSPEQARREAIQMEAIVQETESFAGLEQK